MSEWQIVLGLMVSVGLLAYLLIALLRAEKL